MRFTFVLDPLGGLMPAHDTSVALMEAAQRLGIELWVTEARELTLDRGEAVAWARAVRVEAAVRAAGHWIVAERWYELGEAETVRLADSDAVLMRTDPPVDQDYLQATMVLDAAAERTLVVNHPAGLRIANEKLLPTLVPDLAPATIITARADQLRAALREWGLAVGKPINGMAGRGIVMLRDGDAGLDSLLELLTDGWRRQIVLQEYLPAACEGDKRILLIDGEPLGAVRRCATPGEFRCNLAVGGVACATELDERDELIIARLAPILRERGLYFAGIDVIGGQLTEVNVTSPTCIREAELLGAEGASARVVEWIADASAATARSSRRPAFSPLSAAVRRNTSWPLLTAS
jgi:glutathione synthase